MTFRIKNTYQFTAAKDYEGNYVTELPQLMFSRSDDSNNSLQNVLEKNQEPLYIKVERLVFNKMFNIDNQNISIFQFNDENKENTFWEFKMTKSLRKVQHDISYLKQYFNEFNEVKIKNLFDEDKTKLSGKLTLQNLNSKDCKVKMKKKMALILGLLHEND